MKQKKVNRAPESSEDLNLSKKHTMEKMDNDEMEKGNFAFDKQNYKWLLIGLAIIFLGFLLMIGGGSDDPNVFNYGMFNFQRLTLAPILLLLGYLTGIYAIMKKPKGSK